ncbi:hypothetical protein [Winogradskyella alexanderae]|uniref:MotA/TolQ/ExbB proton channel family protein n=1 Tax=Winogradskyella alexanderae TaxID=2877123 RepID=A0ABS7XUH6_9FLAO|nr:hypothetical protein [Winogradskyella alexanderae]MCA0133044.1 hypothetical protein [Winogradskyella alexanderae]
MNSYDYLQLIGMILSGISSLGIVTATIILFIKKKTFSTTILLIGSILTILFGVGSFIANRAAGNHGAETLIKTIGWSKFIGGFLSILFCSGLLIFAIKDFKRS